MVSGGTNSTNGQSHRIALPAGFALHWYQIESVLGQGGFGITYLALDTNLNNHVAIKEFLPTDLATRTQDSSVMPISDDQSDTYSWGVNRFIIEAQTLAKFRHPNIVQVLAVFEANNTAYMVMEYVKGSTLEDALKSKTIQGEEELKRILFAILEGLERIHNGGYIHRDIKPDNIYLREDETPVLLDFGSARQAIGAQTRTLTALVSPGYAPLEQYDNSTDGERKQGPWTDIYALGATLFRAIVGKGPPDAMQRVNAMVGGTDPYTSMTELGKGKFSESFLRAIDYALAFHPEERPQSIAEWRFALEGNLSPEAKTAVFATPGTKASAFQRIAPARTETSAVATRQKTERGATEAETGREFGAQPQGPIDESAPFPRRGNEWGPIAAVVVIAIVVGAMFWFGTASEDNQPESANSVAATSPGEETGSPAMEEPLDPEKEARRRAEEARRQAAALEKQLEAQQQLAKAEAKRVAELEAERERKERITALLDGARSDLAEGRLTRPKENNAFYRLSKVIALDSENAAAKEALKGVVEGLVARSGEAIGKQDFSDAAAHLAEADAVLPGSQIVAEARVALEQAKVAYEQEQRQVAEAKVREAEQTAHLEAERRETEAIEKAAAEPVKAEEIETLLVLARTDLDSFRLTWPPGSNALERYRRVLELDPANSKAEAGIQEVGAKYLELTDRAVAQENFDKAKGYLDKAAQVLPKSDAVKQARDAYQVARTSFEQSQTTGEPEPLTEARAELERLKLEQKKLETQIQEKSTPAVLTSAGEKLRVAIVPFWGSSQNSLYINGHDQWLEELARNIVSKHDKLDVVFSSYAQKPPEGVNTELEQVWDSTGGRRVPNTDALLKIGNELSVNAVLILGYRISGDNDLYMTMLEAYVFDVSRQKLYSSGNNVGLVTSPTRTDLAANIVRTVLAEYMKTD